MKPNILVFMTDHQQGDTMSQNSPVKTPNLDAFLNKSVTFSNAYCPSPHCCPSRATFFSGLYPSEHGVWNNVNVSNCLSRGLFEEVRLFSQDLIENGYDAYLSGKWHVSYEQGPEDFGFKLLYHNNNYKKFLNRPDMSEWDVYLKENAQIDNGSEERKEAQCIRPGYTNYIQYGIDEHPFDDDVVDAAVDKLNQIKETDLPFFMFVGPLGPHDPYFVPQRFLDLYDINEIHLPDNFEDTMADKPALYRRTQDQFSQLTREEQKECIRRYYAFCSYEDWQFGRLVDTVKEKGMMENTVILYVSDHGDYVGSHGLWTKGLPCFKEAYHICSVIGGCGIEKPGRIEEAFVSLADYAPTILELAGIKHQNNYSGQSLVPFLQNEKPKEWRAEMCSQTNGNEIYGIQRAVWNKKWKYVFNTFDFDELYDLESDAGELHNLLHGIRQVEKSPYAELVKNMCTTMWKFAYKHQDICVDPYIMTAFAPYGPGIIFEENGGKNE